MVPDPPQPDGRAVARSKRSPLVRILRIDRKDQKPYRLGSGVSSMSGYLSPTFFTANATSSMGSTKSGAEVRV